jgi:hypothetical protein
VLALAVGLFVIDNLPVGGFYDDAFYVILAKSLATGQGYRNLNLPGAPHAVHYPPGYPLFLAALWRIAPAFPGNVFWFKVANALFLSVAAGCAYQFGRQRLGLSPVVALVGTAAGTVTTPALYLSSMVLSETMFLALAIPLLIWAERATSRDDQDVGGALALGACAGLLFLVRSHAVALIGAIAIVYALRRRWKESGLSLLGAAVVTAPWMLWVAEHNAAVPALMRGDYGSYFGWLVDGLRERGMDLVLTTLRRNIPALLQIVVRRLQPPENPIPNLVVSLCVGGLAAFGFVRLARRARVTFVFLAAYCAIAAIWPFVPVRFFLGIWVLLMLVLTSGVQSLIEQRRPAGAGRDRNLWIAGRAFWVTASVVLVTGAFAYNVRGFSHHWWSTTEAQSARWIAPKIEWVRTHTDSAAIIATDHDEGGLYLYTGRRAVPATTFTAAEYVAPRDVQADAAAFTKLATHWHARYMLLSSPRLHPAALALGAQGTPLGDANHRTVPWVFTLPALATRPLGDTVTLRASR